MLPEELGDVPVRRVMMARPGLVATTDVLHLSLCRLVQPKQLELFVELLVLAAPRLMQFDDTNMGSGSPLPGPGLYYKIFISELGLWKPSSRTRSLLQNLHFRAWALEALLQDQVFTTKSSFQSLGSGSHSLAVFPQFRRELSVTDTVSDKGRAANGLVHGLHLGLGFRAQALNFSGLPPLCDRGAPSGISAE